ncbi:MAG: alpha-1,2-fucosyltransferase [Lachnospiraceae bacterium]|nr:alpha-1,2-fucosyltransferase [Lachnospiraceae bacterium]
MNIVRISDGLGNQMFQYAFARKISVTTGHKVYLDTRFINNEDLIGKEKNSYFKKKLAYREYGLLHFNIKLPVADGRVLIPWKYIEQSGYLQQAVYGLANQGFWLWKYKRENFNFERELSWVDRMLPTYYQGYFFDLKYYDDIKLVLQHEFSLKDKVKLPRELRDILSKKNTVSLHIRRGDFLKLNRDISESAYYRKAVQIIQKKIVNPIFLIFSDDISWVKENMKIHDEKIYLSGMGFNDYEEFAIMKHCSHNIIANSTFSYWAAYLNSKKDKIVICPKHWRNSIIPKEWIQC